MILSIAIKEETNRCYVPVMPFWSSLAKKQSVNQICWSTNQFMGNKRHRGTCLMTSQDTISKIQTMEKKTKVKRPGFFTKYIAMERKKEMNGKPIA